jgi:hypothetical protein
MDLELQKEGTSQKEQLSSIFKASKVLNASGLL